MSISLAQVPGCLSKLCDCQSHYLHSQWISVFECVEPQECAKREDHYQYLDAGHLDVSIFCFLICRSHSTSFWDSVRRNFSMCSCTVYLVHPWEEGNSRPSNVDILAQSLLFSITVSNCALSHSFLGEELNISLQWLFQPLSVIKAVSFKFS